jgi:hypothetical protein
MQSRKAASIVNKAHQGLGLDKGAHGNHGQIWLPGAWWQPISTQVALTLPDLFKNYSLFWSSSSGEAPA